MLHKTYMLLPDHPIQKENDKLKRAPIAAKVAEMVAGFKGEESFVVGIEGQWGAGKTSFVEMVLSELKSDDTIVIKFNPWNFSGQNELIADFFSSFVEGIEEKVGKDVVKTVKSYASKLQVSFSPSVPIPFLGSIGIGEIWKNGAPSLQKQRKEIDATLKKIGKKIVVVIDDIDRLDKEETRLVMKLVKMNANFPNTIFLLAYDRVHVASRLKEDGWPGDEFLKKIVQVPFTLPKPDEQGMRELLFGDLDQTIEMFYGKFKLEGENERRWNKFVYAGFPTLFKTIRDIKRYISSLRLNWSIVNIADVNMIDFIIIEAIRVFYPRFHSIIAANKSFFLATHGVFARMNYRDNETKRKQRFEEMLNEAEITVPQEREMVKDICEELFPQLENQNYGGDWQVEWRNSQRICSDTRFDLYFQLGIPAGNVSELEINGIIDLLDNKEDFLKEIVRLSAEKRTRPILSRITDRLKTISKDKLENLILALWSLEGVVRDEQTAVFDFDDFDSATYRITVHTLKNISAKPERKAFLDKAVIETDSLFNPIKLIRSVEEEAEKKRSEEHVLFTSEEMSDSKKVLIQRIEKWAAENKLHKVQHFPFVLFVWKKWVSDEPVKKYVGDFVKTKAGAAAFIDGFVGMTYSTNGNYKDINKKVIGEICNLADLEKTVSEITEDELEKFTQSEKEAIAVFKNPPERW